DPTVALDAAPGGDEPAAGGVALAPGVALGVAARVLRDALAAAGVDRPDPEVGWLLEAATGLGRAEQVLERERPLEANEAARLVAWAERRVRREPLQLVLGVAPFYGFDVQVRPGVLVPRPESERLVELVLDRLRDVARPRVHDVGTGSGAIALALAAARPDATVTASDVDPTAVLVARANATALGLTVAVWASDLLADPIVRRAAAEAQALVANLPYLPESDRGTLPPEVAHDPPGALFAGPDGLDLARRLAREAAPLVRPGATVWWELDPRNVAVFVAELEASEAWAEVACFRDLTGRDRFVMARR
ncbi:MAG: peptide chain release factor N(5)-glutamine methyltransferase, partial [Trueperaceae bacterium]|nr:peptide chain release factor N(5)-glutamine methyltransferase [Trueperaceae bacterium]